MQFTSGKTRTVALCAKRGRVKSVEFIVVTQYIRIRIMSAVRGRQSAEKSFVVQHVAVGDVWY